MQRKVKQSLEKNCVETDLDEKEEPSSSGLWQSEIMSTEKNKNKREQKADKHLRVSEVYDVSFSCERSVVVPQRSVDV